MYAQKCTPNNTNNKVGNTGIKCAHHRYLAHLT